MTDLRIRMEGVRTPFAPRARWVLETLAEALGRTPRWTDGEADLVYAPHPPERGVWIPADDAAQAFFEGQEAFPTTATHESRGLTLLFAPTQPDREIPGDLVASAFYLLARWDELRVPERDRFGRLPLAASAFGRIAGLNLEEPVVEGYIAALRDALGIPAPTTWSVALTHDIDRIRRRTPKGLAGIARRRGPGAVARTLVGPDPWNNIPDLLEASWLRGVRPTVFLIGRNAHPLDGTPRRTYERERRSLAAAVRAAGAEVGLHASFGSSEDGAALASELAGLRAEVGDIQGVRFHYLRFRYHQTVRWLEQAGASYDSSLGFSEAPGFAAGIARPYHPYLIGEERPARLTLLPLAVMDTMLDSHLTLGAAGARDRALAVLDRVRVHGGRVALLWHNTYLADDRAPGYGPLWGDLLDELTARGAALGPAGDPTPPAPGERLAGRRIVHLTSVHRPRDVRIFHKEARAAAEAGAAAWVGAPASPIPRAGAWPPGGGWRGRRGRATPTSTTSTTRSCCPRPCGWRAQRRPVVYDVHEYLGQTTRTKRWIPGPLRRPLALAVERAERRAARRLDGVVTANEDLAARFAGAGARAVSVTNSPWSDAFPAPAPMPDEPVVLYVGGLGPLRGLEVMRAAFPRVAVDGARLLLVGPGDPGDLPAGVEALGVVDHSEVPALLAASTGGVDPAPAPRQLRSRGADEARGGDGRRAAGGGQRPGPDGGDGARRRVRPRGAARRRRCPRDGARAAARRSRGGRADGRRRAGGLPGRASGSRPRRGRSHRSTRGSSTGEPRPLRLPVLRERRPARRRAPLAAHARPGAGRPRGERRDLVRPAQGAHGARAVSRPQDGARGRGRPGRVAHLLDAGLRPRPALARRQLRHLRLVVGRGRARTPRPDVVVASSPSLPAAAAAAALARRAGRGSCWRSATCGRTRRSPWASCATGARSPSPAAWRPTATAAPIASWRSPRASATASSPRASARRGSA